MPARKAGLCLLAHLLGLVAGPAGAVAAGSLSRPGAAALPGAVGASSDSARAPGFPPLNESGGSATGIVISGVGVAAGVGLAVWLKNEANLRYDRYQRTADPARARDAFNAAQRYDRATLIGWGVAEVSFVALFYYLTREEKRPLVPVRGEPVLRSGEDGVQIGFRVTP
jgi:hypothetical protein